jgi:hypothetical protein
MSAAKRKAAKNELTDKATMGRPIKYSEKLIPAVSALVLRGLTDVEIAQVIGIAVRTLYAWKLAHPDFAQTLQRSKDVVNEQVEATLIQKALGFERDQSCR